MRDALARLGSAAARGELIGFTAPLLDFAWSHPETYQSLDDLKGNVVVLDFWTTWCGPCVASFPNVRKLQELYKDYPVKIIGVASIQGSVFGPDGSIDCKDDPDMEMNLMSSYIKQRNITWIIAFSKQNVYNPDYGIRGIPHVVILDPKGKVRFNGLHPGDPIREKAIKINDILAEFNLPVPPLPPEG